MAINDVRNFIEALEASGDLLRIKEEVDWDVEAGAMAQLGCELQGPAFLLENITDYPGHRMLLGPLCTWRRAAIALGLSPETPKKEIIDDVYKRLENPIKPVIVKDAPCQENVVMGDDVDLMAFPAPMVHDGDGGRYIGTWGALVVKDPDTGWVNYGMYRAMIHNERYLGGLVLPHSDAGKIFHGKYVPKNKPMPFARIIGIDPIMGLAACIPVGVEISEPDMAGGLMGEPVPLVKCKTVDLEVPAYAEVVLEGEFLPSETVAEGPFGEFSGFRTSPRVARSVAKVNCITYRNDPVHVCSIAGMPVDESHLITSGIGMTRMMKKILLDNGLPIKEAYCPPEGAGCLGVVSTNTPIAGMANTISNLIFGGRLLTTTIQHSIVVGPDVDPFDMNKVIHALATQCHPGRGISIRNKEFLVPLVPSLSYEERLWQSGSKAAYDCTFPVDWKTEIETPPRADFRTIFTEKAQARVLEILGKYGIKPE